MADDDSSVPPTPTTPSGGLTGDDEFERRREERRKRMEALSNTSMSAGNDKETGLERGKGDSLIGRGGRDGEEARADVLRSRRKERETFESSCLSTSFAWGSV